jgi:hypothetical protein
MALWSGVTVLVAHPEPRSQPAIASKNNFFITCNIDAAAMVAFEKEHYRSAPVPGRSIARRLRGAAISKPTSQSASRCARGRARSGEPLPMIPNGFLTRSNGSPNGLNFHKYLIRRKVYGLTGKTPLETP